MDFVTAIVLGLVEGLTEFLPVSSTGHLILVNQWFRFASPEFTAAFDIIIQVGAILAVVLFFRRRLNPFTRDGVQRGKVTQLWLKAIVGILPVIVLTLAVEKITGHKLDDLIHDQFFAPLPVAIALAFWGLAIIGLELWNSRRAKAGHQALYAEAELLPWGTVILIGLIQCIALWPGTSRSAITLIGAMLLGASRVAAAEYSFFLAIPTLLGAGAYKLWGLVKSGTHLAGTEWGLLAVGTLVAFFSAWAVVAFFMRFVQRNTLVPFGIYRVVLGVVIIIFLVPH